MAQFSSYIEGPRWPGAEMAILDYCYSHVTPFYLNSGIGALLYAATCQELKKKNLKLYASGLQSDSAKKLWEKFEEKDCVTYVKDRKYVDLPSPEHLFS